MYYNTDRINYTFGADFMYTNMKSLYGSEMNGRFYFTGLDNFENMTPYRYAREIALVDDPTVKMNTLNSAIYGQLITNEAFHRIRGHGRYPCGLYPLFQPREL